jgi:uncharacterized protein (TIGR02147 family)
VAAPNLSAVLGGTKGLSFTSAQQVVKVLKLSETESTFFLHSILALHARDEKQRIASQKTLARLAESKSFQTLATPKFSLINEWFYLSLLQTFDLKDFEPSVAWIARKLGLSAKEVSSALKVLEEVGLVKKAEGFYRPLRAFNKTEDIPSRTIRVYLQEMLKKASEALETQSIEERDFSATVFAIDRERVPEFKTKIAEFREAFCQDASESRTKTDVYNLSIQFFRISNQKEKI